MTYIPAERGFIYSWENPNTDNCNSNKCLVVSADERCEDNLVSILFLSTIRASGHGKDIVPINYNGEKLCVHTGLVTYTKRDYLIRKLNKISDDTMARVDRKIAIELGITNERENLYEDLYNDLMTRLINDSDIGGVI